MRDYIQATGLRKYTGLMFRTRKTNPLIFDFYKEVELPIHSWFVFFPFYAVWINGGRVVKREVIYPFKSNIKPDEPFTRLIEVPLR